MADGGVINVVSSRCKKICGVFMLFVLSFQVFTFLHCFQLLLAQTPASLIILLCIGIHLSFYGFLVVLVISFGFPMHCLAQLFPLPSKYFRGWQTFCIKVPGDLNAQDDRDW
jgi:hypothetical protein